MAEVKGELVTPVGFRADGTVRALELTDSDELKVSANATVLADMLTALEKIDDLRNALDSVNTDEIVVNVDQSVLPTGAALATLQATMITSLQLIDNLVGCLNSVDTDVLITKVSASVNPTGAATAANQTSMIIALQLIDDLRGALDSIDTDELVVNVDESVLPTGAATSAAQATLETEVGKNLKTADIEIVTDIPSVGSHGWIGGALRKQPMMLGYSDRKIEIINNASLGAGTSNNNGSAVPAGEIWVITAFSAQIISTTITDLEVGIITSSPAAATYLLTEYPPVTGEWYPLNGTWVLAEGDYFRCVVRGATAGDGLKFRALGTRVDLDQ